MWNSAARCICSSIQKLHLLPRPLLAARSEVLWSRSIGSGLIKSSSPSQGESLKNESINTVGPTDIEANGISESYYNDIVNSKYTVLGKSVLQSYLVEHLLHVYQHLDASKIADLAAYFTKEILPLANQYSSDKDCTLAEKRATMYEEIGKMYDSEGQLAVFEHVKGLTSYHVSEDDIDLYCKLVHPAPTLEAILQSKGLRFEARRTGRRSVGVFIENQMVLESAASTLVKAEYLACISVIRKDYLPDVKNVMLKPSKKIFKKRFRGKFSGRRVVELSKSDNEHFGLFLKGGEKATIETDKFFRYNFIEPVYISKLLPGSAAANSGLLQEGDVILSVGDFTLNTLTVESAVALVNREDNVILTVKYDPNIKSIEKMKSEFKSRENKAFKDTLKVEDWRKWHEANVEERPGRYVDVK